MPSSYSTDLRIELIATGEQSGTWGQTTNNNLGVLIEDAIAGMASVTTIISPYSLTAVNGVADQARCSALQLQTTTGANFTVVVPTVTKLYVVKNVDSTYAVTVKTASGSGVVIPANKTALLRCDGTNVVEQLDYVAGNLGVGTNLAVAGTSTLTGAVSAPAGVTGNLTGNVAGNVTGNLTGNVAAGAGTIATTNYTLTEVGGELFIKYQTTNIGKIDSSGNLTVIGNVTAYGTV
jgi:hypothetical protein